MIVSRKVSSVFRWPLFIAYLLLLYVSFTLPSEQLPEAVTYANDKVLHFLDFFLLGLLAFRTFTLPSRPLFQVQAGGKAAVFSLLYGTFLEVLQQRVPGRDASVWDWTADLVGVLVASGIFRISRLTPSP